MRKKVRFLRKRSTSLVYSYDAYDQSRFMMYPVVISRVHCLQSITRNSVRLPRTVGEGVALRELYIPSSWHLVIDRILKMYSSNTMPCRQNTVCICTKTLNNMLFHVHSSSQQIIIASLLKKIQMLHNVQKAAICTLAYTLYETKERVFWSKCVKRTPPFANQATGLVLAITTH